MKKKIKIQTSQSLKLILVASFTLVLTFTLILTTKTITEKRQLCADNNKANQINKEYINTDTFFDEGLFNIGIGEVKQVQSKNIENAKIAVIPHHTLPSFLISGLFINVSKNIDTVVLIGPDHNLKSNTPFTLTDIGWETHFGKVETNYSINNCLHKNLGNLVLTNNNLVENDHSIGAIVPYIKYYLPNAKVTSIVVSPKTNEVEINKLVDSLKEIQGENTLIVAAIDFSHYRTSSKAQEYDLITKDLIINKNYRKILSLDNNHTDDPRSLVTILKLAEAYNLKTNIIHNTNSGIILNDPYTLTTSYFLITFD